MKPMIYKKEYIVEVLHEGNYKGYDFAIVSQGPHPTAYVRIPETHQLYGVHYRYLTAVVEWGFTFSRHTKDYHFEDGYWIGWDHAHCDDYSGAHPEFGGKKWTTEEVYEEVKEVIEWLLWPLEGDDES